MCSLGCVVICCAIFCFISGMSLMSSVCVGIYIYALLAMGIGVRFYYDYL